MVEHTMYFEDINNALLRVWGKRSGLRVLDVGCGRATTTQHIQRLGNELTGIERNPSSSAVAATRITRVLPYDLDELDAIDAAIGDERFDVVIFADVLEHLVSPVETLRHFARYVREGGSIIVSLPNVALWFVRLELLAGFLVYEDSGVLDKTHLRFFTRRSAKAMLRTAGFEPLRAAYNPGLARPLVPVAKKIMLSRAKEERDPAALLNSGLYQFYLKFVEPVERTIARAWPTLLAWQMVFEAKKRQ